MDQRSVQLAIPLILNTRSTWTVQISSYSYQFQNEIWAQKMREAIAVCALFHFTDPGIRGSWNTCIGRVLPFVISGDRDNKRWICSVTGF